MTQDPVYFVRGTEHKPSLTTPLPQTIFNNCPGGPWCNLVRDYNEALLAVLVVDLLFFAVTLFPPAFSWSNREEQSWSYHILSMMFF